MEVDKSSLIVSKAGRDKGQLFYVIDTDEQYVYLADGKSRKVLNSELRKELASFGQKQSQNQGG